MLDSPVFSTIVDKVTESPAIQQVMRDAEQGTLCAGADGIHAVSACLLDGGLLRTVADATCEAAGVSSAECEQVHATASSMLGRLGLRGDGWTGWIVRSMILQPWLSTALCVALLLLLAPLGVLLVLRVCARQGKPEECVGGGADQRHRLNDSTAQPAPGTTASPDHPAAPCGPSADSVGERGGG